MVFSEVTNDIEIMRPPEGTAYAFNADAAIKAGQVVKVTSDNGVSPSNTDGEQAIGVAAQSVSAGDQVMVLGEGARVRFTAGAAVTAGTQVTSHGGTGDDGTVADAAAAAGDYAIGIAHEAASSGNTFIGTVVLGGQVN